MHLPPQLLGWNLAQPEIRLKTVVLLKRISTERKVADFIDLASWEIFIAKFSSMRVLDMWHA